VKRMAEHICLKCRNASPEVPAEVIVEQVRRGEVTETETEWRIEKIKESVNIAEELKRTLSGMQKTYKHVLYCSAEKTIIVGGDSPAQMRKQCDKFAAARS